MCQKKIPVIEIITYPLQHMRPNHLPSLIVQNELTHALETYFFHRISLESHTKTMA